MALTYSSTNVLEAAINEHVSNDDIHITAEDRSKWNAAANKLDIDLSKYATSDSVDSKLQKFKDEQNFLLDIPSSYTTDEEVEAKMIEVNKSISNISELFDEFYTKEQINELFQPKSDTIDCVIGVDYDKSSGVLTVVRSNGSNTRITFKGVNGTSSITKTVYTSSLNQPNAPVGGSYDFSSKGFVLPTGTNGTVWTEARSLTGNIWMSLCTFSDTDSDEDIPDWSDPMLISAEKTTTVYSSSSISHVVIAYHIGTRIIAGDSTSGYYYLTEAPSKPEGGVYDFASNQLITLPNNPNDSGDYWSLDPDFTKTFANEYVTDEDGNPTVMLETWYFSMGTVSEGDETIDWSTPAVFGVDYTLVASSMLFIAINYSLLAKQVDFTADDFAVNIAGCVSAYMSDEGITFTNLYSKLALTDELISAVADNITLTTDLLETVAKNVVLTSDQVTVAALNITVKSDITDFTGSVRATSLNVMFLDSETNDYIPRVAFATNSHKEDGVEDNVKYLDNASDDTPVMVIFGKDGYTVEYVVALTKWNVSTASNHQTITIHTVKMNSSNGAFDTTTTTIYKQLDTDSDGENTYYSTYDEETSTLSNEWSGTYYTYSLTDVVDTLYWEQIYPDYRIYYKYPEAKVLKCLITSTTIENGKHKSTSSQYGYLCWDTSSSSGIQSSSAGRWRFINDSDSLYNEAYVGYPVLSPDKDNMYVDASSVRTITSSDVHNLYKLIQAALNSIAYYSGDTYDEYIKSIDGEEFSSMDDALLFIYRLITAVSSGSSTTEEEFLYDLYVAAKSGTGTTLDTILQLIVSRGTLGSLTNTEYYDSIKDILLMTVRLASSACQYTCLCGKSELGNYYQQVSNYQRLYV